MNRPSAQSAESQANGQMPPADPRGAGSITVFAVVMLCIGLTVAATFGEFAIGILAPAFERDLAAEPSQLGMLMAVMFACNALVAMPAGMLADRVDPRKTIFLQMFICALAFGSIALVAEPAQLFFPVAVIGAAMSLNAPMTNRIVINFVPLQHRGAAVAWKSVGLQVGSLAVGLTFGLTESFSHWRTTIVVVTVLLVVMGLLAHMRFRRATPVGLARVETVVTDSAATDSVTSVAGAAHVNEAVVEAVAPSRERIAEPIVWWLIPYCLFTIGAFTCVAAYMVLFATTDVGVSSASAATASGVAAGVSIVARFIWVRWLTRKNEALILGLAALCSAGAIGLLAISPAFGEVGFWVAAIAIGCTLLASTPVQQIVLMQNTNTRYIGRVSSVIGIAIALSLAGMPFLISIFIDSIGLQSTWSIVIGITLVGSLTMVLFTLHRAFRARRAAETEANESTVNSLKD